MTKNRKKDICRVGAITLDLSKLSQALNLPPDIVKEEFMDGRVASRFTEHWAMFGNMLRKSNKSIRRL